MRTVSFPNHSKWEFHGNVSQAAVCLGDVDNDGDSEFAVANGSGTLAIFKGLESQRPWRTASGLGSVSCLAIGDVLNLGKGACHLFEVTPDQNPRRLESESVVELPALVQPVPANINKAMIADTDGDGLNELIVTRTDRMLHVFKFIIDEAGENDADRLKMVEMVKCQLPGQTSSFTMGFSAKGMPQIVVAQPGGTYITVDHTGKMNENPLLSSSTASSITSLGAQTEVVCTNSQSLRSSERLISHRIPYTGPVKNLRGGPKAKPANSLRNFASVPAFVKRFNSSSPPPSGFHSPATSNSPHSASEDPKLILLPPPPTEPPVFFIVTVDGTIKFQGQNTWQLQVEHQLFSMGKIAVSPLSPNDAVAICSWDGLTYIIDSQQNAVRFQFPGSVAAFASGRFSSFPGVHKECLIFVDFNNQITVYHDLGLTDLSSNTLLTLLTKHPRYPELLAFIGETTETVNSDTPKKLAQAFSTLLYQTSPTGEPVS